MTMILAVLAVLTLPLRAVEVTVYNDNLGLVKETRPFSLKAGVNELKIVDVAAQIDPTSVHFRSLTAPDAVSVLEQDFQYDLISQEKLLQKYLGKEIELRRFFGANGERQETTRGTLLSATDGRVIKVGDKILINPPGEPVLPELPEGLLTKPTLVWKLQARKGGAQQGELSYLTQGLSWNADYVLVADKDDVKADLTAWVTVNNASGAAYKDARLKLIAGDVHRAPVPRAMDGLKARRAMAAMGAVPEEGFVERQFFEYHLYTLQRPTTLADNSSKQVELASAADIPLKKLYVYDGAAQVGWMGMLAPNYDPDYGTESGKKVSVSFELRNDKASGLGMPLPRGRVRVYKKDDDGSLQLAGEDTIDHTPKDEKVRVKLGEAFDLVGERKRTDFHSDVRGRRMEESFEIKLRNHKDSAATIDVVEHLYRWNNWKIVDASQKWTKKDAQTIEFQVPVQKDGEAVVRYTVRYSW